MTISLHTDVGRRRITSTSQEDGCHTRPRGVFFGEPGDEIETRYGSVLDTFKYIVLSGEFNKVLDLLQLMIKIVKRQTGESTLANRIHVSFAEHAAPYWLDTFCDGCQFVPCSSEEQASAAKEALETLGEENMDGATTHLRDAAGHINSGQFADAIADSIHAVESVARVLDPEANKTLTPALNSLENAGVLNHRALKEAFSKLYGYTSDEQGIRHALLTNSAADVGQDEALFMFGACASFAAYLTQKHQQVKASA